MAKRKVEIDVYGLEAMEKAIKKAMKKAMRKIGHDIKGGIVPTGRLASSIEYARYIEGGSPHRAHPGETVMSRPAFVRCEYCDTAVREPERVQCKQCGAPLRKGREGQNDQDNLAITRS